MYVRSCLSVIISMCVPVNDGWAETAFSFFLFRHLSLILFKFFFIHTITYKNVYFTLLQVSKEIHQGEPCWLCSKYCYSNRGAELLLALEIFLVLLYFCCYFWQIWGR